MPNLFATVDSSERLHVPGADVTYIEQLKLPRSPATILEELRSGIAWRHEDIVIQGRAYKQPRLTAWYGDPEAGYTYSGLSLTPHPWTPLLLELKALAEESAGAKFNSVLLNKYRNHRDSIGFHSDNERELRPRPTIASMSFGAERIFILKPKHPGPKPVRIPLASGSLLIMAGDTQKNWLHGIEKEATPHGPRVNLTFRQIF